MPATCKAPYPHRICAARARMRRDGFTNAAKTYRRVDGTWVLTAWNVSNSEQRQVEIRVNHAGLRAIFKLALDKLGKLL